MARDEGAAALKEEAAKRALRFVQPGMVLGLGTGTTVEPFIRELAARVADGGLPETVGVATSVRTARLADSLGIRISDLAQVGRIDLAVDGADEVSPSLDLVKGLGGALLREKMVAQASDRLVIVADGSKVVRRLGERVSIPVEVIEWGADSHVPFLEGLGATVALRTHADGSRYVTDNGNVIWDCRFNGCVPDPQGLERELEARSGVVEHGLFLGMAECAVIARPRGVEVMRRARSGGETEPHLRRRSAPGEREVCARTELGL